MTGKIPHHVRLAQLFDQVRDEIDSCHADGLTIPPMTVTAMTNLGISLLVIRGQETGETMDPRSAISAMMAGESKIPGLDVAGTGPTRLPG